MTEPESDLTTLLPYLKRCQENVFREIDENEWNDFLVGKSLLNPSSHISKLISRKMLLVHGKEDETIRSYHTERFYNSLIAGSGKAMAHLLVVDGVGHGKRLRAKTWDYWTNWILN